MVMELCTWLCLQPIMETELMHSDAENDLHKDVKFHSELWHALDALITKLSKYPLNLM